MNLGEKKFHKVSATAKDRESADAVILIEE
jgi:hypothetical protein